MIIKKACILYIEVPHNVMDKWSHNLSTLLYYVYMYIEVPQPSSLMLIFKMP